MKLTVIAFTYGRETGLLLPLVRNIRRASGEIPAEDVRICIINDANASLPQETIDLLNAEVGVTVVNSTVDRRGNLRSAEFIAEAAGAMAVLSEGSDYVVKLDPDTVPVSLESIVKPLVEDEGVVASFPPSGAEVEFGMGFCYCIRRSVLPLFAEAMEGIDAATLDIAMDYARVSMPSAGPGYNFPIREDMFLSRLAMRFGEVVFGVKGRYFDEPAVEIETAKAGVDAVLIGPAVMSYGRERAGVLAELIAGASGEASVVGEGPAKVVFGIGTGYCGTAYAARLLSQQPGCVVTHEMAGLIARDKPLVAASWIRKNRKLHESRSPVLVGDVNLCLTHHARAILEHAASVGDEVRVFGLKRDRDELIASIVAGAAGRSPIGLHGWRRALPDYDAEADPEVMAAAVVDGMWAEMDALAEDFPESYRAFDIADLNDQAGVDEFFDWCGVPAANRVYALVGMPINGKS